MCQPNEGHYYLNVTIGLHNVHNINAGDLT